MLAPAFADPVTSSQATFRSVMNALARPGTPHGTPTDVALPAPLGRGMAAVALALCDNESPVWLDQPLAAAPEVAHWLRFRTGAPITADRQQAAFALVSDVTAMPPFAGFALGTAEYPDRSATLVVSVEALSGVPSLRIAGPGIAGERAFGDAAAACPGRKLACQSGAVSARGRFDLCLR